MAFAVLCAVLLTSVDAHPAHKMFMPTIPPNVEFGSAITVPQKYRDMMLAPERAEEELAQHQGLTEADLDAQRDDPFAALGLIQHGTAARTGTARMLSNMGTVERMLSKELAGHPEIRNEELKDIRQAEDLVHSAGQLMPHKHTTAAMKHPAFMQQKTKAKAMTTASLAAEARSELHSYGLKMKTLAQADRQTAKKLGQARDTVEEALEAAGASAKLENQVDAMLSKAEKYSRRIVTHESSEAKDALKKAFTFGH